MPALTTPQLRTIMAVGDDDARPDVWLTPLNLAMLAGDITSAAQQAAFLSQILVESAALRQVEEALSYSLPRLRAVWPQRFPSDVQAAPFVHAPERLANHVYANRMGNGDEASGDGWTYRGRGLIQLTGRDNYTRLAQDRQLDAVNRPDLLLQPANAALSAGWFWQTHRLNPLADLSAGADGDQHFVELTRRINGGTNGLPERNAYWQRALSVLNRPA